MTPFAPSSYNPAPAYATPTSQIAFIRRVYALLVGSILVATLGACAALYLGTPIVANTGNGATIAIPPAVAFLSQHWILAMLGFIGAFFGASFLRRTPGVNVLALFGFTFVSGLFIAPALYFAQMMASQGATLDASPVRDAFLLTSAAFVGMSAYTLITKKDFSFLGAALSMGLWVVIGASILGFFVHAAVFQLAIASAGALLFAGYVLYDTSRLLRDGERDAVGAALRLYLDVMNLFLFILRILGSSRDRS